jgi:hypothetical protein
MQGLDFFPTFPRTTRPNDTRREEEYWLLRFGWEYDDSIYQSTWHAHRNIHAFVPDIPVHREWVDKRRYERYGTAKEENGLIESMVRPMEERDA